MVRPLFRAFVFIYVKDEKLDELRNIPGALSLVYWLNEPVVVSPAEIDSIRIFLKKYEHVRTEKTAVKQQYTGKMAETLLLLQKSTHNEQEVKIILPSLGYYLIASTKKE